jgi:transposase
MIALPAGVKVWLAAGATDMRKGFDGLAAVIQMQLSEDPFSGQLFVFRGKAGDRVKILWWSGDGLCQPVHQSGAAPQRSRRSYLPWCPPSKHLN